MKKIAFMTLLAVTLAGIAGAADVNVASNITTSVRWTADNVYHLRQVIYVEPGASLTIDPGTLIRGNTDSALVVAKGAKIFANGRPNAPIIMTSEQDDLVTWREKCEEWGNLTILGNALIAATKDSQGTGQPDGQDTSQMEGLVARFNGDTLPLFGGNNDDDDSGVIRYVSLRYGGHVVSMANELNGLSLGGVGRQTEIDHVEIMNNVDDGIEIWGGTVCLKYVNIWNIGDDSFDVDQGWRGKAQFGLIVQGYCSTKGQGSGIGDNCIEMDGAEWTSAQPVGAASIYNFTVIGQNFDPTSANKSGDNATEWRDNMRAQFGNCIFMGIGEKLIKDAVSDNEPAGSPGYGSPGVPTLKELFALPYSVYPTNTVGVDPKVLYPNFTSGTWCQFTDCLFFDSRETATLDEFGQLVPALRNKVVTASPIANIQRDSVKMVKDILMARVTKLNPLAANDAVASVGTAPDDGFFSPVPFIGAFGSHNWLKGWTAADIYGLVE
ncbi:MAG: hypothetical protein JW955_12630 [Sedimentisphaerales bacterium]|nr:hypothetical protein [Sedimentisphaerales bacterium]